MYVLTKQLPEMIQSVLKSIGYGKQDIKLEVAETFSLASGGMGGRRSFVVLVNLSTKETKRLNGSWSGPNMFNPSNPVDLDTTPRQIPENALIIEGSEGYGGTFATLIVKDTTLVPQLNAPKDELSPDEKQVLKVMNSYKSFARLEYLTGYYADKYGNGRRFTETELDATYKLLESKGLIKINKAGSKSITTKGKNALG